MEKGGSKSNFFGFGKVNCIELNLNLSGTKWYKDYWSWNVHPGSQIFKQFMMFHSIVRKLVIFLRLYQIYWQEQSIRYLIWIWNEFRQISHGDKYLSLVLILENHWASKCLVLFNKTSFLLLFNAIQAVIYNIFKQKL